MTVIFTENLSKQGPDGGRKHTHTHTRTLVLMNYKVCTQTLRLKVRTDLLLLGGLCVKIGSDGTEAKPAGYTEHKLSYDSANE